MKMKLKGAIELVDRVRVKGQACWGVTQAHGQTFRIRVARSAIHNGAMFAETLLHEMLHLWIFIVCSAMGKQTSARRHHEIIDAIVPKAIRMLSESRFRNED